MKCFWCVEMIENRDPEANIPWDVALEATCFIRWSVPPSDFTPLRLCCEKHNRRFPEVVIVPLDDGMDEWIVQEVMLS